MIEKVLLPRDVQACGTDRNDMNQMILWTEMEQMLHCVKIMSYYTSLPNKLSIICTISWRGSSSPPDTASSKRSKARAWPQRISVTSFSCRKSFVWKKAQFVVNEHIEFDWKPCKILIFEDRRDEFKLLIYIVHCTGERFANYAELIVFILSLQGIKQHRAGSTHSSMQQRWLWFSAADMHTDQWGMQIAIIQTLWLVRGSVL